VNEVILLFYFDFSEIVSYVSKYGCDAF